MMIPTPEIHGSILNGSWVSNGTNAGIINDATVTIPDDSYNYDPSLTIPFDKFIIFPWPELPVVSLPFSGPTDIDILVLPKDPNEKKKMLEEALKKVEPVPAKVCPEVQKGRLIEVGE
ncbi:hypothetical protein A2Z67_02755 [Candidatus Woesebacteria bacterium RBG_13_36_22]|uniref:Uncharacterized protein n=1 Tax=Candidatus Woesebacteria bacterium RBG_13_36_22 TaxID=1802478 RepID=A0A1F7X707_9BACT|nr:MAG: hypothetical protein A2Z67_02755 [Candidatus Woesebacteria bacterium RBG_13_36_22]